MGATNTLVVNALCTMVNLRLLRETRKDSRTGDVTDDGVPRKSDDDSAGEELVVSLCAMVFGVSNGGTNPCYPTVAPESPKGHSRLMGSKFFIAKSPSAGVSYLLETAMKASMNHHLTID